MKSVKGGKSKLLQAVCAVRNEIYAAVREQLSDESKTYQQAADAVGCSLATVQRIAQRDGVTRTVGPRRKSSSVGVCHGNE
jgi:DNA invertase Pin-like site-specific DNA recombinase